MDFIDANGPVKAREETKCVICGKRVSILGLKHHIIAVHGGTYPAPPAQRKP